MEADYTSPKTICLSDFIRNEQTQYKDPSGALSTLMLSIALGTKILSRGVNGAGLAAMLGLTGETNVQGEAVQKLDAFSDKVFGSILSKSREVVSMVTEERESMFIPDEANATSRYVIAFDPLDGSSNIDVNVSIGSIWGIYKRVSSGKVVDPKDIRDFCQPCRQQVAAGYTIYGSSTMLVYTTGNGVNGFTLDPTIGEYVLTHPKMKIPEDGNIYSCNEGNSNSWTLGVRKYIESLKSSSAAGRKGPCSHRYVGSLVADFHRTLLKGGIFLYPADEKNKQGKLRLLYECAPLAMIADQASGLASHGSGPILDLVPESIHQRTPLFIGSQKMVQELERSLIRYSQN